MARQTVRQISRQSYGNVAANVGIMSQQRRGKCRIMVTENVRQNDILLVAAKLRQTKIV
jgi:hypothetical protein